MCTFIFSVIFIYVIVRPLLFLLLVKVEQACHGCGCYVSFIFSVIFNYFLKMLHIYAMYFDVIHLPLPPSNSPWYPCFLSLIASHFPSFGCFYTLSPIRALYLCVDSISVVSTEENNPPPPSTTTNSSSTKCRSLLGPAPSILES